MLAAVLSALALSAPPKVQLVDGRVVQLAGRPATVIVFVSHDCPIANDSQPALERAYQRFKGKGVGFIGVYIDPRLTAREAAAHKKEYGFSYDQSVDTRHALVGYLKATVTPEAYVLDRTGKVCYRGRINDMYNDLGSRKAKVTTNDLEDAIAAVVAGKAPKSSRTTAHGCVIPELKDFGGL